MVFIFKCTSRPSEKFSLHTYMDTRPVYRAILHSIILFTHTHMDTRPVYRAILHSIILMLKFIFYYSFTCLKRCQIRIPLKLALLWHNSEKAGSGQFYREPVSSGRRVHLGQWMRNETCNPPITTPVLGPFLSPATLIYILITSIK